MDVQKWLQTYNGQSKPTPKAKESLRHIDKWDRGDVDEMVRRVRPFKTARGNLLKVVPATGGHATIDSAMSLMKVDPKVRGAEDMDAAYFLNRAVIGELMRTPEWERLRQWTVGDLINTAMSFVDLEPLLEQLFDKNKKLMDEHQQKIQQMLEQLQELLDQLKELEQQMPDLEAAVQAAQPDQDEDEDGTGQQGQQGAQGLADAEEALQNAQGQQQSLEEQIQSMLDALGAAVEAAEQAAESAAAGAMPSMRASMGEAADRQQQFDDLANGFGQEPAALRRMPAEVRLKYADKLNNPKFQKLAELIGPLMRVAMAEQMRKVDFSPDEMHDVTLGGDLHRIVPSEMLNFARPETRRLFVRRMNERELLEYEFHGKEKAGKGGIICCMDNSGSMAGAPEVWAKAVGLALLAIAKHQKRSFYGIHFAFARDIKTFDFRDSANVGLDQVIEYAEHFFNGGTNFERPLTEALSLLQEEEREKGFVNGDIVFITDDACSVNPKWLAQFCAERERLGFKVWGIAIGASRKSEPLNTICDGNVVTIQDLLSAEGVKDMFRDI